MDPEVCQGVYPQLLRPKAADVVNWSHLNEANHLWLEIRAHFKILEALSLSVCNMHSYTL